MLLGSTDMGDTRMAHKTSYWEDMRTCVSDRCTGLRTYVRRIRMIVRTRWNRIFAIAYIVTDGEKW